MDVLWGTWEMSMGLTKNGSVAGRPRETALSQHYTSAAGVAGQLQPLVRRTAKGAGTGPTGTATLQASRNRGHNERAMTFKLMRTSSGSRRPDDQGPSHRLHRVRLTKNGSVAGRPRGVALSREYTSAAGVAGQLQPLVIPPPAHRPSFGSSSARQARRTLRRTNHLDHLLPRHQLFCRRSSEARLVDVRQEHR